MSEIQCSVPCMFFRGGTSRGLYFLEKDLPSAGEERDGVLLKIYGSPDKKQIDGIGGATSVTSKAAIISASENPDWDVNYTFAQISVDKPIVSYDGNCGNISSGVGPFAIEKGLVKSHSPVTQVKIFNTNTKKIIIADVQTPDGKVVYTGDFTIPGVPGSAAPVKLTFVDPEGSVCEKLLPTGNTLDTLEVAGFGNVEVSIVDAANPLVFIRAKDLGLEGPELADNMDSRTDLLDTFEKIRGQAAVQLGFIEKPEEASWKSPGVPKMTIVAPPEEYKTSGGNLISKEDTDILSRMMSMQKPHATYAMTGAMCTVAAAVIPGTLVWEAARKELSGNVLRIGHPGGVMEAGVSYHYDNGEIRIESTFGYRTARLLMSGMAYYSI